MKPIVKALICEKCELGRVNGTMVCFINLKKFMA